MTVRRFAERRQWPLEGVEARCATVTEQGRMAALDVELELTGPLDATQRQTLHDVARGCPVSRAVGAGLPITVR